MSKQSSWPARLGASSKLYVRIALRIRRSIIYLCNFFREVAIDIDEVAVMGVSSRPAEVVEALNAIGFFVSPAGVLTLPSDEYVV